jgi:multidrug transporter EmrE-like cation transporter
VTELLGALVAGGSALLYDAGYVLEKQALTELPPLRLTPAGIIRTAGSSRRWLAGFVAMLVGLGLQVVALTLAPVSVVQPILAGGLIALAAAGGSLLGETLDRRHRWALVLVLIAVVGVAASARGGSVIGRSVPLGSFALMGLVVAGGAVAAFVVSRRLERGAVGLAGTAVAAGLFYGYGAVAEKAVATRLVSGGVVSGAVGSLATAYPWVFLVTSLAGMVVFQGGLQAHPASLMASLTNTVSTVCALVGAAIVFGESPLPSGWWIAVRVAGLLSGAGAVAVLVAGPSLNASGDPAERTRPDHAVAP